jgi:Cache 3/Cache 2 fusion domain
MKLTLRRKICGLAILAAGLPVLVLLIIMTLSQARIVREAENELTSLEVYGLNQTAHNIYALCRSSNALTQAKVDLDLNVARRLLDEGGRLSLSSERVNWQAVNQFTRDTQNIAIPRMVIGGAPLPRVQDFQTKLPVVDEVKDLVGSDASIFQRINTQGDMLRVATTIALTPGLRGVGTFIPAVNTDGTPNGVVSNVLAGQKYEGVVDDSNRSFVAAYEPLRGASGAIIGMLFVGEEVNRLESIKRTL